ncbi:hypothetical protein P152DRAFT_382075, partial [Eremomyces bilateralis CBS 781.70]
PLRGAVICCTSIASELRSEIAQIAEQLGALHHYDLRNDVTHLIVGNTDTPKYKYVARERPDVKVLLSSFILACRDHWREGDEQAPSKVAEWVAQLEREHRVPVFHGLRISVTGFEDLQVRQTINRAIRDNGALYSGDLTREVTHLIAKEPQGKKYEFAMQWGIKVVALEWLQDSLQRGLILEENLYDPRTPPEQRGVGATVAAPLPSPPQIELGNTVAVSHLGRDSDEDTAGKKRRKIRRTTSKRLEGSGEMWAEITSRGPEVGKQGEWDVDEPEKGVTPDGSPQLDQSEVNEELQFTAEPTLEADVSSRSGPRASKPKAQGIFRRRAVFIWAFERKKVSWMHPLGFLVLPHEHPFSTEASILSTSLSDLNLPHAYHNPVSHMSIVTDQWVEQCLHSKTLMEIPEERPATNPTWKSTVMLQPFKQLGAGVVHGWKDLRICTTGIHDIDLLHVSRVLKLMGAVFVENLTKDVDILVSAAPEADARRSAGTQLTQSRKIDFAMREHIPVVDVEWLYDCL